MLSLPLYFILTGGYVQYRTVVKTLGALPDPIVGKSQKIEEFKAEIYEDSSARLSFKVPVKSFRSGNSQRDRDVAKILGYPKYKYIVFESHISKGKVEKFLSNTKGVVYVKGKLTVKGKSKTYTFKVFYKRLENGKVELYTKKKVKFTDFGIKPPTLLGFLKRAPDELEVEGKFTLKVRP